MVDVISLVEHAIVVWYARREADAVYAASALEYACLSKYSFYSDSF